MITDLNNKDEVDDEHEDTQENDEARAVTVTAQHCQLSPRPGVGPKTWPSTLSPTGWIS